METEPERSVRLARATLVLGMSALAAIAVFIAASFVNGPGATSWQMATFGTPLSIPEQLGRRLADLYLGWSAWLFVIASLLAVAGLFSGLLAVGRGMGREPDVRRGMLATAIALVADLVVAMLIAASLSSAYRVVNLIV